MKARYEAHGELPTETRPGGRERTFGRCGVRRPEPNPAAGLRYATFRQADGVGFIHLVSHNEADGRNAVTALPAFKAFAEGVKDRCETPPVRVELTEIGSYGFFDE